MLPEDIGPQRLVTLLQGRRLGVRHEVWESIDSTNERARVLAEVGVGEGFLVLADAQSAGRGSQGRAWESPPGSDLYLSLVLRPHYGAAELPLLTMAAATALVEVADHRLRGETRAQVKWPNDLYIGARKCAGILVESRSSGSRCDFAILGIGLNVNRRHWPAELRENATSLLEATGRSQSFDRGIVLAELLEALERSLAQIESGQSSLLLSRLEPRLLWRGEEVECSGLRGQLLGFDPSGALRLATVEGTRTCVSGSPRRVG